MDGLGSKYNAIKRIDIDIRDLSPYKRYIDGLYPYKKYIPNGSVFAAWFYFNNKEEMSVVDRYLGLTLWDKTYEGYVPEEIVPGEWILIYDDGGYLSWSEKDHFLMMKESHEQKLKDINRLLDILGEE